MRSLVLVLVTVAAGCTFPDGDRCTGVAKRVDGDCRLVFPATDGSDGAIDGSEAGTDAGDSGDGGEGGLACGDSSCPAACNPRTGKCVECLRNDDCSDNGVRKLCTEEHECVQCFGSAECKDPNAPHCSEDGLCSSCIADEDCNRFGMVCDEPNAQCVECTEDKSCKDGKLCDTADHTCRGSTSVCEACTSSAQCLVGLECVATTFNDAPHGNYCLVRADESRLCPRRFSLWSNGLCFPDTFTTCEAVLAYQSLCPANVPPDDISLDCGTGDVPGSICGADSRCTYPCDSNTDCSSGSVCRGGAITYCQPGP